MKNLNEMSSSSHACWPLRSPLMRRVPWWVSGTVRRTTFRLLTSASQRTLARPTEAQSSTSLSATLARAVLMWMGRRPCPMENLSYQPERLTFDVHRLDGSVVSFRVELTDADHATLFRTSDHEPGGSSFPLVRVNP